MLAPPPSLWWSSLGHVEARPALSADLDVDVVIVGGGYSGLWTALELQRLDPSLRLCLLEQSLCGFGASGRNGGWASGLFPVSEERVALDYGAEAARHLTLTLRRAVSELGVSLRELSLDVDFSHGGTVTVARSELQATRLREAVSRAHARGDTTRDLAWLEADEVRERVTMTSLFGATYSPHCAVLHPAKYVRGLAEAVSRRSPIYENSAVMRVQPATSRRRARVILRGGTVSADTVVLATEGYTPTMARRRREVAPIYSLMIATETLSPEFWRETGLAHRETFADDRHLIIYGQRTQDDRLAFGGRGAPYHFGSTVEPRFDDEPKVFSALERTLRDLFPHLPSEPLVTHRWGGALAMPRRHYPYVSLDRQSGIARLGGYTGDGVVLSYVAGRALAQQIARPDEVTDLSRLAFVGQNPRNWEPEPLRVAGINLGLALAQRSDNTEARRNRTSRASALLERLL